MDEDKIILLLKSAIQIAVIGAGNNSYGFVNHNGKQYELINIFKSCSVKYNNDPRGKLEDDDITPRRLTRFFRFQITKFLKDNKTSSYLWNKYSTKDIKFKDICFPGAEHFITSNQEISYLIQTYQQVDNVLGTLFVNRIKRVFIARGLLNNSGEFIRNSRQSPQLIRKLTRE